jgi:fatty acid-binding protein DegV
VELLMGKVRDVGQTRTTRRAIERLVELTCSLGPVERLAVLHTYAPGVEELCQRLIDLCSPKQLLTVAVTTIIGAHVGPRGLGVAALVAE